jgi:hypothetical protein
MTLKTSNTVALYLVSNCRSGVFVKPIITSLVEAISLTPKPAGINRADARVRIVTVKQRVKRRRCPPHALTLSSI